MSQSPSNSAIVGAGKGGIVPPVEHRFALGNPGSPGRPRSAGLTIREAINELILKEYTEHDLREIARDKRCKASRRIAAERILKAMEFGDLADFEPWLNGEMTMAQLKQAGLNTEAIKKAKIGDKGGRELELHDRSRPEVELLINQTELSIGDEEKNKRLDEGKATENVGIVVNVAAVE